MVEDLACHYHPKNRSITTCERCGAPICNLDRRVYTKRSNKQRNKSPSSIAYDQFSSMPETYEYCILCNSDINRIEATGIQIVTILLFSLLIIFLVLSFTSSIGLLGIAFLIGIIAFRFLYEYYNLKDRVTRSKIEAEQLLHDIGHGTSYSKSRVSCYNCGLPILPKDWYCTECGISTKYSK